MSAAASSPVTPAEAAGAGVNSAATTEMTYLQAISELTSSAE